VVAQGARIIFEGDSGFFSQYLASRWPGAGIPAHAMSQLGMP
jgi:hypothetical protein